MRTGYQAYQKARVQTSTPQQLVVMLFKEAVLSTEMAVQAMESKDYETVNARLNKVQDIMSELMAALDFRMPIAQNLFQLYEYVYNLLVQGNVKKSDEPLQEAITLLNELHNTWIEASQHAKTDAPPSTGSVTIVR